MISANIASIPEREEQLKHTVYSLLKQVNIINVCLNNYNHNPFEKEKKVNVVFSDNSLGDAGKFMFLKGFNGYYFTCDDDLIYDPYYVEDTILRMNRSRHKIVTYHGRSFDSFPIDSYYKSASKKYRCLGDVNSDYTVQFGGTGCMAFHTSNFNIPIDKFERSNMSDIWIGIHAHKTNTPITVLKHEEGYIKYQHVKGTIYDDKCNNDSIETEIVNYNFR